MKNFKCTLILFSFIVLPFFTVANATAQRTKQIDPTDFVTQFGLKNEWTDKQGGGYKNRLVPRYEYAASGSLAFRFELPVVANNVYQIGHDTDFGVGDLSTQIRWRFKKGKGFKLISGLGLTWDTASETVLGGGKKVVKPFLFASIRLSQYKLMLFPYLQYDYSVDEDDGSSDTKLLFFSPIVFKMLPNRYYTMIFPTFYLNKGLNDKVGMKLEIEGGKFVSKKTMAYVTPGFGVYSEVLPQVYNWRLIVGFRHFFK